MARDLVRQAVEGALAGGSHENKRSVMQDTMGNEQGDLYEQLMAISQEALINQHYETAYHALTAAQHYAQDLRDKQRLQAVVQAAKAQIEWIDASAPTHRMSRQAAIKRNGISMYDMLARQAGMQALMIRQKHRPEHTNDFLPSGGFGET